MNNMAGRIFDIQKFSIQDGPGIRTLIFFKGCPLGCLWCSNPESQRKEIELMHYEDRCALCGKCAEACPSGNITLVKSVSGIVHKIDRKKCKGRGECVKACPNDALKLVGYAKNAEEIFSIILEDYLFYLNSNGGVTLGGGEPTMQPDLALTLLKKCKKYDIHTAIETCGYTEWKVLEALSEYLDLIFFDIKHMSPDIHKKITGVSNEKILNNAIKVLEREVPIVIRIPIIKGINDNEENLTNTMEFLKKNNKKGKIQRIELLPYHKLGINKYKKLAMTYELEDLQRPSQTSLNEAELLVSSFGFLSKIEAI